MSDSTDILIIRTVSELRKWRKKIRGTVGFIPTMGYLHAGHKSLIDLAREENDFVVVSIFVNPKQFGPHDDLNKYPRDEKHDLNLLTQSRVDVAFLPEVSDMYPDGYETQVSETHLSKKLEGERRLGHFDGVTTVIAKFFIIIQPEKAYFGQKDAQQVLIIKKMVQDLQFPVSIIVGETIRQENGLALSSRNKFLSQKQMDESAAIFQSLHFAQKLVKQGEKKCETIKKEMQKIINKTSGEIDYISIVDPQTLDELEIVQHNALVSLAVYYGETRLIDNCMIQI